MLKYCLNIFISLLLFNLKFKAKLLISRRKGNKGFRKLGNDKLVVLITSKSWLAIENSTSSIRKICDIQINDRNIKIFAKKYLK